MKTAAASGGSISTAWTDDENFTLFCYWSATKGRLMRVLSDRKDMLDVMNMIRYYMIERKDYLVLNIAHVAGW
jgi:hypothetical protein